MTAPHADQEAHTLALARLQSAMAEDAIFTLAAAGRGHPAALEGLGKRRTEAHTAVLQGTATPRMIESFDAWVVSMTHAIAPVAPPVWMPMGDVIGEKVTLEAGARGIRSFFSSKPSEKDIQRVKRLGALTTRLLRAVFSADGPIDAEEARTISALVSSLGLPDADTTQLVTEAPVGVEHLDLYGEVEPAISRALVSGAWLAAAWDAIDPREEAVVRAFANKVALPADELERLRAEAIQKVDARRVSGLAAVDAVRYMLTDRTPGFAPYLATKVGHLMLPRRYREEALGQIGHGTPVTLAKRYGSTSADERMSVMGIAWAAAIFDDPTMARRALLRARHERIAQDLGDEGKRARVMVDEWISELLQPFASNMK